MSRYYKQMQHGRNEAKHLLRERLAREEMGDEAYDKMVSNHDGRAFKVFGIVHRLHGNRGSHRSVAGLLKTSTQPSDAGERMSAGWVNLVVLIAVLLIVTCAATIFYVAAARRGGRKKPGLARPSKSHYRKVNPKTGDLFR
jgi:hypothetical protein